MTLCVGDVLIITPRCPFPNWSTAHHSPNSYGAHVPTPVTPLTGGSDVFLPIFIDRGSQYSMQQ